MTDNVSITYIPPTIMTNISIFSISAKVPITPPRASEPVSPINIFAGKALNFKNPSKAPAKAIAKTATSKFCVLKPTIAKKVNTIIVTEVASPSTPSVKFTALVTAA